MTRLSAWQYALCAIALSGEPRPYATGHSELRSGAAQGRTGVASSGERDSI